MGLTDTSTVKYWYILLVFVWVVCQGVSLVQRFLLQSPPPLNFILTLIPFKLCAIDFSNVHIPYSPSEDKIYLNAIKFQEGTSSGTYFNDYCNWKKIPEFQEYVHNSPAAELAGTLMCSKVS